ncbi:unnamed protein product [Gongylonema pulchrum]|uniref:nicotinate phosphoribosyltransferase n=1 Tax=Gongylonema pulchrum TaxID=637853 RepID=A0A3P7MM09_9BILA|nr:unnamed protein product [Gongylonema pulchrum]
MKIYCYRKNPFGGEYTVFAGLEDCLHYIKNFQFSKSDIVFLRSVLPGITNPAFFEYLESLDCSSVTVRAAAEGSIVFPNVPLITVEGPLAVCQLLETALLTLVNYSSLVTTNALRFRNVSYFLYHHDHFEILSKCPSCYGLLSLIDVEWASIWTLVLRDASNVQIGAPQTHPATGDLSTGWNHAKTHDRSGKSVTGNNVQLFEFGLRRAQGPNGGLSASKYCFLGGKCKKI